MDEQVHVAIESQRWILAERMKGREEDARAQVAVVHEQPLRLKWNVSPCGGVDQLSFVPAAPPAVKARRLA
jgi:hypothetical protein